MSATAVSGYVGPVASQRLLHNVIVVAVIQELIEEYNICFLIKQAEITRCGTVNNMTLCVTVFRMTWSGKSLHVIYYELQNHRLHYV